MRLLRCGCEGWDGESVHYCANFPTHGEIVQKIYRAERQDEEAWKRLSDADCFAFLAAHPEVNALSPQVKLWTWLEQEWGR